MGEQSEDALRHKPRVVGITGSAGSGKSTVTGILATLGAQTADADALVRWAYADADLQRAISGRFGADTILPGGGINRERLAQIVFAEAEARAHLEAMVHPAVLGQMAGMIEAYRQDPSRAPVLALEIPLLYEAGADSMVDRVVVVAAPADVCAGRLRQRGWSEERIQSVMAAQMPLEEKIRRADDVINATGSLEDTVSAVERLWERLTTS